MDPSKCIAESLPYLPEIITTLLISYTPVQNKKFLKIVHVSGHENGINVLLVKKKKKKKKEEERKKEEKIGKRITEN